MRRSKGELREEERDAKKGISTGKSSLAAASSSSSSLQEQNADMGAGRSDCEISEEEGDDKKGLITEKLAASSSSSEETERDTDMVAQWEWCDDSLIWVPYCPSASDTIEKAFQSGRALVAVDLGHSTYNVIFQPRASQQKNLSTGRTRSVKRETKDDGSTSWLWLQEETQCWHSYRQGLAAQIEKAWKVCDASRSVKTERAPSGLFFTVNGQAYCAEFETDAVQCNARTQFSRGVRRSFYRRVVGLPSIDETTPNVVGSCSFQSSSSSWTPNDPTNDAQSCSKAQIRGSLSSSADKALGYNMADIVDFESPDDTDDCTICLSSLVGSTAVILTKCKHSYHRKCIESWFKNRPSCPECLMVYGTITGTQPTGEMHIQYITYGAREAKYGLSGHPDTDVIKITYKFPNGIQTVEHPNPGKPYVGTTRIAYLPKNTDGEEVLELLQKAWDRRLLFRVGTSVTTGQNNVVVWSGIHHKTRMNGGSTNHGYVKLSAYLLFF